MRLPDTMLIGGIDPVDLYIVACNSHDGTSAFRLLISPVRVVCGNTQALAIAGRSRRSRSGTPPVPAATSVRPGRRWG